MNLELEKFIRLPSRFYQYSVFWWLAATLLISLAIVFQPMLTLTLLVGVPALLLVVARRTRFIGLLTILFLSPFLGIIKAFTGVRLAPLAFDLALLILIIFSLTDEIFTYNLKVSLLELLIFFFFLLGVAQIFNPNVPSVLVGLEGFRATAFQSLAVFAGVLLVKSKKQIRQLMIVLTISGLLVATYGIKQFFFPTAIDFKIVQSSLASPITYTALGKMRAFSTLSGPFHLGIFMVLSILLITQSPWPKRIFLRILITVVLAAALIMSITRANWLALAAGIAFIIVLAPIKGKTNWSLRPIVIATTIILAALLLFNIIPYYFSNPAYQYLSSLENIQSTRRYQGTVNNWRKVIIPAIISNPFGYGAGSAGDGINSKFLGPSFTSHNIFLKMGLELGTIGLILFPVILILVMARGIKIYFKLNDVFLKKTSLWILSFVVAIIVAGISTPITDAYPANLYLWLLIGILLSLREIEKREMQCKLT